MSHDADILTAFLQRVQTFAAARSLPVAWPNVPFTPPGTGAWLEVAWFPNETRDLALGNDAAELRGFGQVSCCMRPGAGMLDPLALAGEVIAAFPKGAPLGVAAVSRRPWASSVLVASERASCYVTIRYSAGIED